MGSKIGRNQPCPCRSGKKFKYCHGGIPGKNFIPKIQSPELIKIIETQKKRHEAREYQRKEQQGLGSPIISENLNGYKLVVIKNKLAYSKKWKTFHDFLGDYLIHAIGPDWFKEENLKIQNEKHTLAKWRETLKEQTEKISKNNKGIAIAKNTGAIAACMELSYHLYLLDHNQGLQETLIRRIKNRDHGNFVGAIAETHVFSTFFKAGYEITFEDESDGSTTHGEFIAKNKNNNTYWIEVKARKAFKDNYDIYNQLRKALNKKTNLPRIIFIEMNVRNAFAEEKIEWVEHINNIWCEMEEDLTLPKGGVPSPAYVFLINNPYEYYLESTEYKTNALLRGFKIDGFQDGYRFTSLEEQLQHRKKHEDIYTLFEAYKKYKAIPSSFDGENPHLFENQPFGPYLIGERYSVDNSEGNTIEAELVDALVDNGTIWCVYQPDKGPSLIHTSKLTSEQAEAYKAHPHTYFGVLKEERGQLRDAADWYYFFYEVYSKTSREKLLEFMSGHPEIDTLKKMSQEELAHKYCVAMTSVTHESSSKKP